MAVVAGSPDAILSGAVGGNGGVTDPLADGVEGLTDGHWSGLDAPEFPPVAPIGEAVGDEKPIHVLYPIVPERATNKLLFRNDNLGWEKTQKSEEEWSHQFNTIQFRIVNAPYMNTFYQFCEDNKGKLVNLVLPGVQPFLKSSEENLVYIKDFSKPVRENHVNYRIDVLVLLNPNEVQP